MAKPSHHDKTSLIDPLLVHFRYPERSERAVKNQDAKFLLFQNKDEFQSGVKVLRQQFSIPPDGFLIGDANGAKKWERLLSKEQKSAFEDELSALLKECHASVRWTLAVRAYIIFSNKNPYPLYPYPVECRIYPLEWRIKGEDSVIVEVFKDATSEDMAETWEQIALNLSYLKGGTKPFVVEGTGSNEAWVILGKGKVEKKKLLKPQRNPTISQIEKGIKILSLKSKGMRNKEIAVQVGWKQSDWNRVSVDLGQIRRRIKAIELY